MQCTLGRNSGFCLFLFGYRSLHCCTKTNNCTEGICLLLHYLLLCYVVKDFCCLTLWGYRYLCLSSISNLSCILFIFILHESLLGLKFVEHAVLFSNVLFSNCIGLAQAFDIAGVYDHKADSDLALALARNSWRIRVSRLIDGSHKPTIQQIQKCLKEVTAGILIFFFRVSDTSL